VSRAAARGPSRAELLAAAERTIEDVIAPDLTVLFCGINPGLYTAWSGHHFARPGNRFWPALHAAGFTDRLLAPAEEQLLLERGYGITNVVRRATATAAELSDLELEQGGRALEEKVLRFRPRFLAMLGIGAYRAAFHRPRAVVGSQTEQIGETRVWVLPSPSGLNANHTLAAHAELLRELRIAASKP
jgi:TDG/mug DNA glycosylase family protein